MIRGGNPVLQYDKFQSEAVDDFPNANVMTVHGAVIKSAILAALLIAAGGVGFVVTNPQFSYLAGVGRFGLIIGTALASFVCGIVMAFAKKSSPFLAPLYAILEGLCIGAISGIYAELWNGIVPQAAMLTIGIMVVMLVAYASGLIRATPFLTKAIIIATGGICLVYFVTFILRMCGVQEVNYLHGAGPVGIGFSLVVVGIAAFNFILDFNLIEQGARSRAPKYMEWYAGYALMVTLVWLYLEVLRLLAKLRSND